MVRCEDVSNALDIMESVKQPNYPPNDEVYMECINYDSFRK